MSDKFIALRREPRTERAQRERAETEETRRAGRPCTEGRNAGTAHRPGPGPGRCVRERGAGGAPQFQKLPYLDAYVVETPDESLERQAKVLDNDLCDRAEFRAFHADTVGRTQLCPQAAGGRRLARRERHQGTRDGAHGRRRHRLYTGHRRRCRSSGIAPQGDRLSPSRSTRRPAMRATAVASTSTGMARTWRASSPARISAWRQAWN